MPEKKKHFAIVLPAGGARAAYQVGVLRYVADNFPDFKPTIFCGVSAGSINSSFLAQGDPFPQAATQLSELWHKIEFNQVIKTNFRSVFAMSSRWVYDMFLSKVTHKLRLRSLLDASPLSQTLLANIHFWKIAKAVRDGIVDGVSVSATNYHVGTTTVFFDSCQPVTAWQREQRNSVRTRIRVKHIMASCSIPLLFEPVRIGDYLYGDGSLRFSFPLSPAIKLGATHLFTIGTRCPNPENALGFRPDHVGMGFVAGAVLNSIFLDSLESDYENLQRLNRSAGAPHRRIHPCIIRPSRDLGATAKDFIDDVPFHWRQVLRSTASPDELGDLLSYLMFTKGFVNRLIELGMKDAEASRDMIRDFINQPVG